VVVLTGPEAADLTGLGAALEAELLTQGRFAYYLGLKNALLGLQADQEASAGTGTLDRSETVRRLGETAHLFADAGALFVTSVPDLDADELEVLRALVRPAEVLTVAVPGPGTGTESPDLPPVTLDLDPGLSPADGAHRIVRLLADRAIVPEYVL